MNPVYKEITDFIRTVYPDNKGIIPLHSPTFSGNEKKYLINCIDTNFVSSVGPYVREFETKVAEFTGASYGIAVVNGTCGLHLSLKVAGVLPGDEVITQPLTFVATSNAISQAGASPVYLDIDHMTMGLSPGSLSDFLSIWCTIEKDGSVKNKKSGRRIAACVPVHTFGHPCRIDIIASVCRKYNIPLVEDAAESLGSLYNGRHTGTFGQCGVLSFNGNKIITTGGGGIILTEDFKFAEKVRHLSTQAKVPHEWEYVHDEAGFNYRLTNLQAALGVAQMESLTHYIENKRALAEKYRNFFNERGIEFFTEPGNSKSNYWLNTILLPDLKERDEFLRYTNERGISTRPAWRLMHKLKMYSGCSGGKLTTAEMLAERIVNIPSSVRNEK